MTIDSRGRLPHGLQMRQKSLDIFGSGGENRHLLRKEKIAKGLEVSPVRFDGGSSTALLDG
jgi:hypothetical protein